MMHVIIVGKGNGWEFAPALDSHLSVWGVNNVCLRRPVNLAFNMHDLDKHKDHKLFNKTIEHVNRFKIPIVTQKDYDHIPTSIPFPLKEIWPRKYFTNSIDYMLAYAFLIRSVTTIDVYGVVMAADTEYTKQRPSLEYWIGKCEGRGIDVVIHEPTLVCKSDKGMYGYNWDEEDMPYVKNRGENQ